MSAEHLSRPDKATKYDGGKPRMDLLDPYAIEQLASVLTYGAQKYAPWNWTKGMEFSRLLGAAHRHLFSFQAGEDIDPESGLPHVAHAMCNLMFLMSMTVRHPDMDDRCVSPNEKPTQPAVEEALKECLEELKGESSFQVGDLVEVYDRYRFALPLKATVEEFSGVNDGVRVKLVESNTPEYPVGRDDIWVHSRQIKFLARRIM